jgi:hypothetical protein
VYLEPILAEENLAIPTNTWTKLLKSIEPENILNPFPSVDCCSGGMLGKSCENTWAM